MGRDYCNADWTISLTRNRMFLWWLIIYKNKLSEINGVQIPDIDIKNDNLYTYNWPGNVRELRNLMRE